ncbi:MAG: hypothetical protein ACTSW6_00075 [Candidatus Baldrarchaeia archaeon]
MLLLSDALDVGNIKVINLKLKMLKGEIANIVGDANQPRVAQIINWRLYEKLCIGCLLAN